MPITAIQPLPGSADHASAADTGLLHPKYDGVHIYHLADGQFNKQENNGQESEVSEKLGVIDAAQPLSVGQPEQNWNADFAGNRSASLARGSDGPAIDGPERRPVQYFMPARSDHLETDDSPGRGHSG